MGCCVSSLNPLPSVMSKTEQSGRGLTCGDGVLIKAGPGRLLPVSLVWMQGTVMEVQPDQNTVVLMDETGTFTVQGVKNIPKGKPCLSPEKLI
uniref:Uncharacterized protein n=1 Tax=Sphaeramia orbicularis TaxID=375764 RepID=A0A672YBQ9_9TELE